MGLNPALTLTARAANPMAPAKNRSAARGFGAISINIHGLTTIGSLLQWWAKKGVGGLVAGSKGQVSKTP
jgi:hypothetical protein